MAKETEERYQMERAIQQQQNKISGSYSRIKALEQQTDDYYSDMAQFNRLREDHERFIYDYESRSKTFIEEASAYNFVKQYENRTRELLYGPERVKAEEELSDRETLLKKKIEENEEAIDLEKKRAYGLRNQLDMLEQDLSRLLQDKT